MLEGSKSIAILLCGVVVSIGAVTPPALAQVSPATPVGSSGQAVTGQAPAAGGLDDIVVTAQRRSETLQNVPIAVSAFNGAALQAQKIDTGADLQTAVPNFTFSKGSRGDNITIRGIGNKQFTSSGDTAVGVHFNGAPVIENRLFETDFFDVERVEVLRGHRVRSMAATPPAASST